MCNNVCNDKDPEEVLKELKIYQNSKKSNKEREIEKKKQDDEIKQYMVELKRKEEDIALKVDKQVTEQKEKQKRDIDIQTKLKKE